MTISLKHFVQTDVKKSTSIKLIKTDVMPNTTILKTENEHQKLDKYRVIYDCGNKVYVKNKSKNKETQK